MVLIFHHRNILFSEELFTTKFNMAQTTFYKMARMEKFAYERNFALAFLATLVALHFTPVSKSVCRSFGLA